MAPGELLGVADQDQRDAEQARPGDVDLARDHEVGLIEAPRAVPGEVRVGEHDPAAGRGRVAAQAPGVGADVGGEVERLAELVDPPRSAGGDLVGRGLGARVGRRARRGGGRLGAGDAVDRDPRARVEHQLVEAPVDVPLGDRPHPGLAGAAGVGDVLDPGLGQVAVVALDVAGDALLDRAPSARRAAAGRSAPRRSRGRGPAGRRDRCRGWKSPPGSRRRGRTSASARRPRSDRCRRSCRCCPARRRSRSRSRCPSSSSPRSSACRRRCG